MWRRQTVGAAGVMVAVAAGLWATAGARAAGDPTTAPASAAPAGTAGATPDARQMAEQIRQLQAKVDRLEAKQPAPVVVPAPGTVAGPTPPANGPVRGGIAAGFGVPTWGDSDPVQSFEPGPAPVARPDGSAPGNLDLVSSISGGWDGAKFEIRSDDGNFSIHPGLVADLRDMTSYRERVPAKGGGSEVTKSGYDTQNGFDASRLRLLFDGTLFHQVSYLVQFSADQGASLTLLDAAATYRFGDGPISLKAGQFKDPVWHERNLSEASLLAVDRSLVEQFLAGGQGSRVQGGAITYDQGRARAQLVAHDGFNTQNTKFFDAGGVPTGVGGASGVSPTNYGFSTRVEYMLLGDRTPAFNPYLQYDQFTSLHDKQDILVVGGGADYSQAGANDLVAHSADIQYNRVGGFSAFAAYYGSYRKILTNQGVSPAGYDYDLGFEGQIAYLIGQRFEPFARYDYVHFDPNSTRQVTGLTSHVLQEITVGANYYVYGQKLKLTADANFLPNGSPADSDAQGVLKGSGNNEFVFRAQVQLAI